MRCALPLALALVVIPSVSFAKPAKRADTKTSIEKIRRARDAEPASPALALQLAQSYFKQDDAPRAMRAYQEYLRLAGKDAPTRERAEAVARIQDLSLVVGSIVVRARPGARILVDGEPAGTAPLGDPVPVAPGKHVVTVEGASTKKVVSVKAEESVSVELEGGGGAPAAVVAAPVAAAPAPEKAPAEKSPAPVAAAPTPQPAPPPAPAAPPPPPPPPSPETPTSLDVPPEEHALAPEHDAKDDKPKSKTWMAWTAAGVLGAGAVVSSVVAINAVSDYNAAKDTMGTTRDELESAQSRGKLFAGVAIGLGAGAITVATLTYLKTRKQEPAPAQPAVGLLLAPTFIGAGGTFR